MQRKLTIAVVAIAFALAGGAAMAAEMPTYGTKNFVPGGDTPSYLSHENAAAPVGSADRTAADADINDRAESAPADTAPEPVARAGTSRHGKYASTGRSSKRYARSGGRSTHGAKSKSAASTRTVSSRKSSASHMAASKSEGVTKVKAVKPTKSTKTTARHAMAKPTARGGETTLASRN